MKQAGTAVAALALTLGAAPSLFAQDARVEVKVVVPGEVKVVVPGEVKVVVPGEVFRQVHRIVETTVGPQVRAEISRAVREAVADLSVIGHEISREVSREVQRGRDQDRRIEQVDKQTTKIALGPNGSLDLKNLSGEIIVTAGTGREVLMEITRRSRGRTEADAKLGLDQVKVEVDHRGDRATVETRYPDQPGQSGRERSPYSVSVYFNITAPAGTRMNLTSISGDLSVKGMRGDLAIDVVSGDIQISDVTRLTTIKSISGETVLMDIDNAADLNVGTVSGDLTLQRVKARRLTANVVSGDVSATDVTAESVELSSMSGTVEYAGPIAPKGRYQLQAHSGDVRVVVGGNVGFDLRAETYSGRIRSDATIEIKGASTSTRSLRGTVGDGSAVVVATTFSGNVFVSRR
jgi:DUF4097 and DUF4098 domain-containing protein YvlB